MGTFRLYTGKMASPTSSPLAWRRLLPGTQGVDSTQISFQEQPAGNYLDWHPAPRRQFVIILSGQLEIGLGDGSKHVFGPGDARLVEDTTGQGHTTGVYGDEACVTATIPLKDQ